MKEKTFVSAVVYVYNAEKVIAGFLRELDTYLDSRYEIFEIILVNDYSVDETRQEIKKAAKDLKGTITVINLAWRHKKELAMLAGTDLAIGDFVFELESTRPDFSLNLLTDLYEKAVSGFDVVYAFPKDSTRFKSKLFYWLLNRLSHLNVDEHTETAKIVSRKALNRALLERGKVRYRKVLYKSGGFPTATLEYLPQRQSLGNDEMTLLQKLTLASDVFIVFSNIGTQVAMMFSAISLIVSVLIGVYAAYVYLSGQATISGWTTTMLFLSAGFAGIFLTLTIIAKYIGTILMEQRRGNLYTVEALDKISNK